MKNTPIFQTPQGEAAFRTWQGEYMACLITNWTVAAPDYAGSFDLFCLERYVGMTSFELRKNTTR